METQKGNYCQIAKAVYFSFQGKKIVLFIFQLHPFLLETKEPGTQRVSFAQFPLVSSSVTFKGNMHPRFLEASTENIRIQKGEQHVLLWNIVSQVVHAKNTVPIFSYSRVPVLDNNDQLLRKSVVHFSFSKKV